MAAVRTGPDQTSGEPESEQARDAAQKEAGATFISSTGETERAIARERSPGLADIDELTAWVGCVRLGAVRHQAASGRGAMGGGSFSRAH